MKEEEDLQKIIKEISDYKYALDESSIVAITDQKGVIKHANDNFCKIAKYSREELIGQDHRIVNSGYHSKEFIKDLWKTIAGGEIWRGEIKNKAKDGTTYWVETTIVPFLNEQGKPYQYVAIRADITQRKQTETHLFQKIKELERSNKELEQFAYIVSHNLRLPVANIMGLVEILKHDDLNEEQKNQFITAIFTSVNKLDEVVNDLNNVLQLRTENTEKREWVSLSELTEDIMESIQNLIIQERVNFSIDFSAINEFFCIKTYLHSIFFNLISNSIKYRKPDRPPFITIKSWLTDDSMILSFQDNGSGIDLIKHKDSVFGLYKRFHSHVDGKGLGLFMVKTQVESLGGKIKINSTQNVGTEFIIEFEKSDLIHTE